MTISKRGRTIRLEARGPGERSRLELRLYSKSNDSIWEFSDTSPYAPGGDRSSTGQVFDPKWGKQEELNRRAPQELRFPTVDVFLKPEMSGVVRLDMKEKGRCCINGNFHPTYVNVEEKIVIDFKTLEHWENALLLEPKSNGIREFYLSVPLTAEEGLWSYEFTPLREDWSGRLGLYVPGSDECLEEAVFGSEVSTPSGASGEDRMTRALKGATEFLKGCRNDKTGSPMEGGHFLLYDMESRCRLRSDWPWSWGPSAQLFALIDDYRDDALALGEASLKQQILDRDHPAYGLVRTTMEPGPMREHGFNNRASAADTLFLVGWGWMPLYNATGDKRFLEASEKVVLAVGKLIERSEGGVIPQAFNLKKMAWDKNMFFESSMSLRGLADFYRATGKEEHKQIMGAYAEKLLSAFEREDGLWESMLYSETGEVSPCNYFTKSFGYCVDGLMALHEAAPDRSYLDKALKMTSHVLDAQREDGSWSVRLDRPIEEVGISDKATALWACLFLRLYKMTGDETYRNAGMKALDWCMDHQYFGEDPVARGGIVGRSWPSGIIYRHWFDVITTYTVSFFGLALKEAMSL